MEKWTLQLCDKFMFSLPLDVHIAVIANCKIRNFFHARHKKERRRFVAVVPSWKLT